VEVFKSQRVRIDSVFGFLVLAELAGSRGVRRQIFRVLTSVSDGYISHI
jgi:hypothetical protein